jgi:hypothetical protein
MIDECSPGHGLQELVSQDRTGGQGLLPEGYALVVLLPELLEIVP